MYDHIKSTGRVLFGGGGGGSKSLAQILFYYACITSSGYCLEYYMFLHKMAI